MNIPLLIRHRIAAVRPLVAGIAMAAVSISGLVQADAPMNNYPTTARVGYVNECIGVNGGTLAALYQCSCAIDRIAAKLTYEEFVEAGTYAKYSALPGEGGGIFRDSGEAKTLAKRYRDLESEARRSCGLAR